MRTSRIAWPVFGMILMVALHANAAPQPQPKPDAKVLPADVDAKPAIDPAKLADSAALRATDARNRLASGNNLKQIALAFHRYVGKEDSAMPANVADKAGKQLLSWRIRLLPYVGEKALYEKFKLDEPWDSKNNLALLEKMPKVFESPRVTVKSKGYTVYQVFDGPGALYESGKTKYKIGNIPDGTSNTIFAVESSKAVPWTKPADIPYDKAKPIPDFGKAYGGKPVCAMADGSVRILNLKIISAATLRSAICPDDGQVLGADW
jgi:Protein of unknown function (DUF1559)